MISLKNLWRIHDWVFEVLIGEIVVFHNDSIGRAWTFTFFKSTISCIEGHVINTCIQTLIGWWSSKTQKRGWRTWSRTGLFSWKKSVLLEMLWNHMKTNLKKRMLWSRLILKINSAKMTNLEPETPLEDFVKQSVVMKHLQGEYFDAWQDSHWWCLFAPFLERSWCDAWNFEVSWRNRNWHQESVHRRAPQDLLPLLVVERRHVVGHRDWQQLLQVLR